MELDRVNRAIAALVGTSPRAGKRKAQLRRAAKPGRRKSASARKKLCILMKKRWAERKKKA
jgi:hypothetical protein